MPFKVIRHDITKMSVDAIVNTANPKPIYAHGTDNAIYKAAGAEQLLAERKKIGDIARGEVAVTPAFQLDAKYIIHTVGPAWVDGKHGELDILRSCYRKSLEKAWELKCKSIAFPLIASGVYGFPKDVALDIALSEIQKFTMKRKSMMAYLVVFGNKAYELSQNTFGAIEAYIDANYVKGAEDEEYAAFVPSPSGNPYEDEVEMAYRRQQLNRRQERRPIPSAPAILSPDEMSWDDLVDLDVKEELTFQEKLFEYIDASGLKATEIYKPMEISKQLYSSMQINKDYHPNKTTALLFCLVLKLDIQQTRDLLGRAGYVLSRGNLSDVIISACIENKMYDLNNIDLVMYKKNLPTLRKTDRAADKKKKAAAKSSSKKAAT